MNKFIYSGDPRGLHLAVLQAEMEHPNKCISCGHWRSMPYPRERLDWGGKCVKIRDWDGSDCASSLIEGKLETTGGYSCASYQPYSEWVKNWASKRDRLPDWMAAEGGE